MEKCLWFVDQQNALPAHRREKHYPGEAAHPVALLFERGELLEFDYVVVADSVLPWFRVRPLPGKEWNFAAGTPMHDQVYAERLSEMLAQPRLQSIVAKQIVDRMRRRFAHHGNAPDRVSDLQSLVRGEHV